MKLYFAFSFLRIARKMETIASNPTERAAFLSLLDEYFYSRASTSSAPASQKPAIVLPTPVAPTPPSSYVPSNTKNKLADSVLSRPGISSKLLQQGGMNSTQANVMSKFGAKHSEVLAPHLANATTTAVKSGWAARTGGAEERQKGPIMPAGLSSGKGIGSVSLNSGADVRTFLSVEIQGETLPEIWLRLSSTAGFSSC